MKVPDLVLSVAALESRKRFDRLADDLSVDIEYRKSGGMVVIETDAERAAMEAFVNRRRESGADVILLDPDAARDRAPHLSDTIRGATWSPLDGQVDPLALTQGFALGAKRNGAAILPHTPVKALHVKGRRIVSVETDRRPVMARRSMRRCWRRGFGGCGRAKPGKRGRGVAGWGFVLSVWRRLMGWRIRGRV